MRFTFSERFRMVGWDNAIDLDNQGGLNQHFTRHRTSAGMIGRWGRGFGFEVKLTHEFRKYFTPADAPFHWNEIFFDQLYITYESTEYLRGKLTIGRQNIFLGEGFVVFDGHPVDGSRSVYFNAIRYDLLLSPKHKITSFVAWQPHEDKLLPVINGRDIDPVFQGERSYQLIEQSEKAAAVYYMGTFGKLKLDSYYIWKTIEEDGTKLVPKSNIKTYGSRLYGNLHPQWAFHLEAAYQGGLMGSKNRSAYAGNAYITFSPGNIKDKGVSILTAGAFMYSGNNMGNETHQAWDPLFARWPKWSEAYIYTSLRENQGRIAYWSNMLAPNIRTRIGLDDAGSLNIEYYRLFAMQETATTAFLSGAGKNRGHLLTAKYNFRISKQLTGHVLWEHFRPGNFYFDGANAYHWARFELLFAL